MTEPIAPPNSAPSTPPATGPRDWRKLALTFALTVLVVVVLVRTFSSAQSLTQTLQTARWEWIWVPLLWMTVNLGLAGLRWTLILRAMGYRVPFRRILFAVLATWPLALVTPSRASDLLRAWAIRDTTPLAHGTGSVMAEKVIDLQSLGLYTLLGSVLSGLWLWGALAAAALLALWTTVLLLLHHLERIVQWRWLVRFEAPIQRFFEVFHELKRQPGRFVVISLCSLLGWAGAIGIITSLLWIFHTPLRVGQVITLWPIALFLAHIPITFAGMGTRDAAFLSLVWVSSQQAIPQASLLAGTLSYALVTVAYPALLGLPFMIRFLPQLRRPSAPVRHDGETNA